MMTDFLITENQIEFFAIELLERRGFEYIYTSNISLDTKTLAKFQKKLYIYLKKIV
jgi:hypothetical protein